jgi:putative membrane protein
MELVTQSLAGLVDFVMYFAMCIAFLVMFKLVYIRFTPYDEWKLVKENNMTAAVALSGSFVGYSIAISGAASNSVNLVDFLIWGVVAFIAQLLAFLVVRFIFLPKITERIQNNEISAGIVLASVSISVGMLNAACMTY